MSVEKITQSLPPPQLAQKINEIIDEKVDVVDGKGLSTNDLTNELKTNYDSAYTHSTTPHAPSDAEKNVNPDWNATSGETQILNKPELGSAALKDAPPSGNASSTQVVLGNDTRLTDSRVANSVPANTPTTMNGMLKGDGSKIVTATSGTDYVAPVSGKGLSTNDLTDTLKGNYDTAYTHSQSAHAPVDAEKNVNADWDSTSGDSEILNKPELGTSSSKNIAVSGDASATEVVMGNDSRLTDSRTANGGKSDSVKNYNDSSEQKFWVGTKAEYDAIVTKDANTQYNVTDDNSDMGITVDEANILIGTYTGTGTHGKDTNSFASANSISCSFVPRCIAVVGGENNLCGFLAVKGVSATISNGNNPYFVGILDVEWNTNNVKWKINNIASNNSNYNGNDVYYAMYQLNSNNMNYAYMILG